MSRRGANGPISGASGRHCDGSCFDWSWVGNGISDATLVWSS